MGTPFPNDLQSVLDGLEPTLRACTRWSDAAHAALQALRRCGVARAALCLRDAASGDLVVRQSFGMEQAADKILRPARPGTMAVERVAGGEALDVLDYAASPWVRSDLEERLGIDGAIAVPIPGEDRPTGVLLMEPEPGADRAAIATVAGGVAVRLAAALPGLGADPAAPSATTEFLEPIAAAVQDCLKATDLEDLSRRVLDHCLRLTGADFGFVGYIEPQTGHLVAPTMTRGIFERCQVAGKSVVFEKPSGLGGWVLDHGKPLIANDPSAHPASVGTPPGHLPIRCFLGTPCLFQDTVRGMIALANKAQGFSTGDLGIAEILAGIHAAGVARFFAERAIAESHDRLLSLYHEAPCGYFSISSDGRITEANRTMARLWGWPDDEFVGHQMVAELIDPASRDAFDHQFVEAKRGRAAACEIVYRRRDGRALAALQSVGIQRDERGFVEGARYTVLDITERQETEAKFRQVSASLSDAIVMADPNGRIAEWNPAAERMFGLPRDAALGEPAARILATHADAVGVSGIDAALRSPSGVPLETLLTRPDGTPLPVELVCSTLDLGSGRHAVAIIRDITRRKRAEAALQERERQLTAALRIARLGNWRWDPAAQILECSPELRRIFGLAPDEPTTRERFFEAVIPADREPVREALVRVRTERRRDCFDYRIMRSDGTVRFLHEEAEPVLDAEGQVLSLWGTIQDVTDARCAETAMRKANRALRTLSSCNRTLVHAPGESELLTGMCRAIVETSGYGYAWIAYPDDAGEPRPMAAYGEICPCVRDPSAPLGIAAEALDPVRQALRSGAPSIAQRIGRDAVLADGASPSCARCCSMLALPLAAPGEAPLGVLSIFAGEPDAFDAAEAELLYELAVDIGYGVAERRLRDERRRTREELERSLERTIEAVAAIVSLRDPYTAGHQTRVAHLAEAMACELGLSEEEAKAIHLAGTVHDIGKICVPADILCRPGQLSDIEREVLAEHPRAGHEIIRRAGLPWPVAEMILQHHEKLDGSGYPEGLYGDRIGRGAKILAVADIVEAMSSDRPYRAALGTEAALAEIQRQAGRQLDGAAVDACIRLFRKGYAIPEVRWD